jgi:hypothetical protein
MNMETDLANPNPIIQNTVSMLCTAADQLHYLNGLTAHGNVLIKNMQKIYEVEHAGLVATLEHSAQFNDVKTIDDLVLYFRLLLQYLDYDAKVKDIAYDKMKYTHMLTKMSDAISDLKDVPGDTLMKIWDVSNDVFDYGAAKYQQVK